MVYSLNRLLTSLDKPEMLVSTTKPLTYTLIKGCSHTVGQPPWKVFCQNNPVREMLQQRTWPDMGSFCCPQQVTCHVFANKKFCQSNTKKWARNNHEAKRWSSQVSWSHPLLLLLQCPHITVRWQLQPPKALSPLSHISITSATHQVPYRATQQPRACSLQLQRAPRTRYAAI